MAVRKANGKNPASAGTKDDVVEQKVVALAEQLGWFLGTVRAKADGWLESPAVQAEVTRIRDGAADLMAHVNRASASAQQAAAGASSSARKAAATVGASARSVVANAGTSAKQAVASAGTTAKKAVATAGTAARKAANANKPVVVTVARRSRGLVDAPGKRHRKPPPQESINKRMGEPVGKQMGQKSFQVGKSRGRG